MKRVLQRLSLGLRVHVRDNFYKIVEISILVRRKGYLRVVLPRSIHAKLEQVGTRGQPQFDTKGRDMVVRYLLPKRNLGTPTIPFETIIILKD